MLGVTNTSQINITNITKDSFSVNFPLNEKTKITYPLYILVVGK
jgi:hypothetical protein